ncbi:hypothetical protein EJB05_11488 [Eragrostis curvula]|uniref:Uncharacterized protein n=1 Tax=Eragrostis curvula TaxID=38414 RepID=A0A5J9VRV0_9POAL|nr:hypothetical protein EJB05_11488 [Eragrostis curvula]
MDAPAGAAAQEARAAEVERLLASVRNYSILLYVGTMVAGLAPRVALKHAPLAVARAASYVADGYNVSVTAAVFAAATVLLQGRLARVLERRPSPSPAPSPRLTPLFAWPLAVCTWGFISLVFVGLLHLGEEGHLVGYGDWAVAGVASAANLAMAVRTVARHLA